MKSNLSLLSRSLILTHPPAIMVLWNVGLGAVVDNASQERSIPVWVTAADDRRHIIGGVQVRISTLMLCECPNAPSASNWLSDERSVRVRWLRCCKG